MKTATFADNAIFQPQETHLQNWKFAFVVKNKNQMLIYHCYSQKLQICFVSSATNPEEGACWFPAAWLSP